MLLLQCFVIFYIFVLPYSNSTIEYRTHTQYTQHTHRQRNSQVHRRISTHMVPVLVLSCSHLNDLNSRTYQTFHTWVCLVRFQKEDLPVVFHSLDFIMKRNIKGYQLSIHRNKKKHFSYKTWYCWELRMNIISVLRSDNCLLLCSYWVCLHFLFNILACYFTIFIMIFNIYFVFSLVSYFRAIHSHCYIHQLFRLYANIYTTTKAFEASL